MDLQTGEWVEPVAPPAAIIWLEGLKKRGLSAKASLAKPFFLAQLLGAIAKAPSQGADLALALGDLLGGLLTTAERRVPFTLPFCFTGPTSGVELPGKRFIFKQIREFALLLTSGLVPPRCGRGPFIPTSVLKRNFNPASFTHSPHSRIHLIHAFTHSPHSPSLYG